MDPAETAAAVPVPVSANARAPAPPKRAAGENAAETRSIARDGMDMIGTDSPAARREHHRTSWKGACLALR
jgi:hypothetical protein